ncbi:recombinase family protein [Demequina sp. NBRC 110051]|uniref:recombinase family protein n=1 Tax=Demequina sp. NBRC 110051 TaxID=1570340 RepID=UPI000A04AE34
MSEHVQGQTVGYARVSTVDQNEARQIAAIGDVDRLFVDKASGKSTDRAALQEMLSYVREGDAVRVQSPDRLARSTTDLLALMSQLAAKGAAVEFTDNPALNTSSPQGQFMLTVLAAVGELERAVIRERQAEGIALARKRGVYDRAPKLSAEAVAKARARIDTHGASVARVARDLGVSRTTLYSALNGRGRYAESR